MPVQLAPKYEVVTTHLPTPKYPRCCLPEPQSLLGVEVGFLARDELCADINISGSGEGTLGLLVLTGTRLQGKVGHCWGGGQRTGAVEAGFGVQICIAALFI